MFGQISTPTLVEEVSPIMFSYNVTGSTQKNVTIDLTTSARFAFISIVSDGELILDNLDILNSGQRTLNALVSFPSLGTKSISVQVRGGNVTVNRLTFSEPVSIVFPSFVDITAQAGITTGNADKYGGPTIADYDDDGDYDMVFNNHNDANFESKVVFNNGDGTVAPNTFDVARWTLQDLHGSSFGDFDNDGDLDLIQTRGGSNGTSPSTPDFYINNNGNLELANEQVGLTSGMRGRTAIWGDYDLDNDLDLLFLNNTWDNPNGGKNVIYKNNGNGTFTIARMDGIEDAIGHRFVMTDINNDHIDDIIATNPLSVWQGNGDFTFTDVTAQWIPSNVSTTNASNHGAAAADIDNDGDFDIYISRGKQAIGSYDYNPLTNRGDFVTSGGEGVTTVDFTASGDITLRDLHIGYTARFSDDYPVFLGAAKTAIVVARRIENNRFNELPITQTSAAGWPSDRSADGIYIGYTGNGQWKFEAVKNGNHFWTLDFSLLGINIPTTNFTANNRNIQDILLRNDGDKFTNVSSQWNIPKGGNHWGVTTGDFNNDGLMDFYVNRYAFIKERVADYMLMNTGTGKFDITTVHGASDRGKESRGDMSQAFDFDLDGKLDILEGSSTYGTWHLFKNTSVNNNNYIIVDVGYSPVSNVDPVSAEVAITTANNTYFKRVGSAGSAYSQSLLDKVHFGLGNENTIQNITVRWRNGEIKTFTNETANKIISTDEAQNFEDTVDCSSLPTQVVSSKAITVPVTYSASQDRDVIVALWEDSTWRGVGRTSVNAGIGTVDVTINLANAPTIGNNYSLRPAIRISGSGWQGNQDGCTLDNISVVSTLEESIDCNFLSSSITATKSINVSVEYSVNQQRDVVVVLRRDNQWYGIGKTTVDAGSGIAQVTINATAIPTSGSTYALRASLRPVGAGWQENFSLCPDKTVSLNNFTVSPNPATNSISINGLQSGNYRASIYNMSGNIVNIETINTGSNTIDISSIPTGMYFIQVAQGATVSTISFVKN